jgi:hypothetical protein
MRMDVSTYRQLFGVIALLIWAASLALPVETDCDSLPIKGYVVLETGWLGPLGGQFGWYANLFMLWTIGQMLFDRPPGGIPTIIGLGLALSALTWERLPSDAGYSTLCQRHVGFYTWIACAVLLAFFALAEWRSDKVTKSRNDLTT